MKILNLVILWIFLSFCASETNAQQNKYTIQGKIDGLGDSSLIYLVHVGSNNIPDTVDKIIPINSVFSFTGNLQLEGDFYFLEIKGKPNYVALFVDSSPIIVTGSMADWPKINVTGSLSNDEFKKFMEMNAIIRQPLDSLAHEAELLSREIEKKLSQKRLDYISQHHNSIYTPYLIMNTITFDAMAKKDAYDQLTDRAKASKYGIELKQQIGNEFSATKVAIGKVSPDFNFPTPEGKLLSLHEILAKGKLTLVDFWASWCGPCRHETPNVKKIYDQFHEKGLNIISISLDRKVEDWKKAIKDDKMNWYHVSDLKGWNSDAAIIFSVSHVPQGFLLDAKGRIIAKDLQGEELYQKVKEQLNN